VDTGGAQRIGEGIRAFRKEVKSVENDSSGSANIAAVFTSAIAEQIRHVGFRKER
jgi:Sec-independent protein translocase protein TatA